MTLDDLTVNFDHVDSRLLLSDWGWLIGENKLPILITIVGDAFVQDEKDGIVHFLDTADGTLSQVAGNFDDFAPLLSEQQFVVDFFSFHVVAPLIRAGDFPGFGQVFSYEIPPCLGGERQASNLKPMDISVHFSMLGQIFEQMKDLPPGTPIRGITLADS